MPLTTEQLGQFVSGQALIRNEGAEYVFRGEIETIGIVNGFLVIHFAWLAKGAAYPLIPHEWFADDVRVYEEQLIDTVGRQSRSEDGTQRLILSCVGPGDLIMLFPPGAKENLDRAQVQVTLEETGAVQGSSEAQG